MGREHGREAVVLGLRNRQTLLLRYFDPRDDNRRRTLWADVQYVDITVWSCQYPVPMRLSQLVGKSPSMSGAHSWSRAERATGLDGKGPACLLPDFALASEGCGSGPSSRQRHLTALTPVTFDVRLATFYSASNLAPGGLHSAIGSRSTPSPSLLYFSLPPLRS